jgi:integrase
MERTRRPTLDELDRLIEHFGRIQDHRPSSVPMQKIVLFALFSTRRQEEITLLRWEDLDGDRILVRDMKHPGDKIDPRSLSQSPNHDGHTLKASEIDHIHFGPKAEFVAQTVCPLYPRKRTLRNPVRPIIKRKFVFPLSHQECPLLLR